jgi:BED zinc finger
MMPSLWISVRIQTFKMASLGVSRSLVWKFFSVGEEKDSAKCGTCDKVVKRDTGNTSNLRRHLPTNHLPQYKELLKLEKKQ